MDFLNQALAQISDVFRSTSPSARITAGLLLAIVVGCVGYLFQYQSAGPEPNELLFGGQSLDDGQINQMMATMAQAGLDDYKRDGNRLLVPRGLRAEYLAAIADGGALPPNFHNYLESALEKGKYFEWGDATRERLKVARQQLLGNVIRHMHWVQDAVVLYDEQQPRGLRRDKLVTASVSVTPQPGESLDPRRAFQMKKLVAAAVAGMRPDDVVVTSMGAESELENDDVLAESFADGYWQDRVAYEQYKKKQILNSLRSIPDVQVEVSTEFGDTSQAPSSDAPDSGGQPGLTAQGPGHHDALLQLKQRQDSKSSKMTDEADNSLAQDRSVHKPTGFTPKQDWATITIPRSYVETIWKQRHPDAKNTPKEEDLRVAQASLITKVEHIVMPLLTRQNKGENQEKQVRVEIVDPIFPSTSDAPTLANNAQTWTNRYGSTLGMIVVAMLSLLVLKSVVKGSATGSLSLALTPSRTIRAEVAGADATDVPNAPQRARLHAKQDTSSQDNLAELVREDFDSAAAVLKSWIGNAG